MQYNHFSIDEKINLVCKNKYQYFLNKKNVLGVGLGYKITNGFYTNQKCIKVFTIKKISKNKLSNNEIIPKFFQGLPTDIVEIGLPIPCSLTNKVRPVLGGYSIGPVSCEDIIYGSMGCLVTDYKKFYLLSNNHVLTDENSLPIGEKIIQPSLEDHGTHNDVIATLAKFVPLKFSTFIHKPENFVDCAIAKLNKMSLASSYIATIGKPAGTATPILHESVQKVGRTTEKTSGIITAIGTTLSVQYDKGSALFKDLIVTSKMSEIGDSGSVLLDSNKYVVGLLFSTSPTNSFYNNIDLVLNSLGVKLVIY